MKGGSNVAPVIIKKKKVVAGDGHHGGAWKVAYADFVTAMMAFFMLMWLLNATTEKQRKGIADYFSPTIAVNRMSGGGDGSLGGDSVFSENTLPKVGTGATSLHPTRAVAARGAIAAPDSGAGEADMAKLEEALLGRGGESVLEENVLRHIELRLTDEGVTIEVFDLPGAPLFTKGNRATPLLQALARGIAAAAAGVENQMAVDAHIRSVPLVRSENPVWADSATRAGVMRDLLTGAGVQEARFDRTTAHADREPVSANPMSERNNRLEVVFLRR